MANREELEQALKDGYTVDVHGQSLRHIKELPRDPPDGSDLEGTITRDPEGRLTRDGMELTLKRGGSVLHEGEPVSDPSALPSAADLAKHDEQRASTVRDSIDQQIAQLHAERAKLDRPREDRITQASGPQQPQGEGSATGQGRPHQPEPPPQPQPQPQRQETRQEPRQEKRGK